MNPGKSSYFYFYVSKSQHIHIFIIKKICWKQFLKLVFSIVSHWVGPTGILSEQSSGNLQERREKTEIMLFSSHIFNKLYFFLLYSSLSAHNNIIISIFSIVSHWVGPTGILYEQSSGNLQESREKTENFFLFSTHIFIKLYFLLSHTLLSALISINLLMYLNCKNFSNNNLNPNTPNFFAPNFFAPKKFDFPSLTRASDS